MLTTLAQRVKHRMADLNISNAQLARLAGVSPPTSFNWANGKTKGIKGEQLLRAAKALQVSPEWLATGRGHEAALSVTQNGAPKPKEQTPADTAQSPEHPYRISDPEPGLVAARIVNSLPPAVASEALAYLRWLASRHLPR